MSNEKSSSIEYWVEMLSPGMRGLVALFFVFTIWCVVTGFSLGDLMNKYADANLEQSSMQFEAQMKMQELQFNATVNSNDKLDTLINTIEGVSKRLDDQEEIAAKIRVEIAEIRTATSLIAHWACAHEKKNEPAFCDALDQNHFDQSN